MTEPILLDVKGLTKAYGPIVALDRFSFSLGAGEVLGLLGPNGAGKTTLISILSGTLRGFEGSVQFKGKDLFSDRRLRASIGIVPQDMAFYEELGAADNLAFFGKLYGLTGRELRERIHELLSLVELEPRSREPIKRFSGGMKRRLNLAIGLLHRPELLLLDEPTVGIDVQAKVRILEIIRGIGDAGTAVVFTTHQLAEVETLCSRIVVMDKGRTMAQGTLKELIQIVGEKEIVSIDGVFTAERAQEIMKSNPDFEVLGVKENGLEVAVSGSEKIPRLVEALIRAQVTVHDIKIKSPSLETVFLKLTGRSLRD